MKTIREKFESKFKIGDASAARIFQMEIDAILTFRDVTDKLKKRIAGFEADLTQACKTNSFIDLPSAKKLYLTSYTLLSLCSKNPWAEHVPFSLAAVRYFLRQDDATPDFQVVDGLKDDVIIMKTIIEHFKLQNEIEEEHLLFTQFIKKYYADFPKEVQEHFRERLA